MITCPPNPFVGRGTLDDARWFVGYETQVRRLWERLKLGSNVSIVGSHGCGKTAILRFVIEESHTYLGTDVKVTRLRLSPVIDSKKAEYKLIRLLAGKRNEDLDLLLEDQRLVLLLDDLGGLNENEPGLGVRRWLRSLVDSLNVQLVATSLQPLHEVFKSDDLKSKDSPLHNVMSDIIKLGGFTK